MTSDQTTPTLTPHGRILETARIRAGLSKRAAAGLAGISEGRWRQVVTGIAKAGAGVEIPVRPRPATLAAMARAVDAPVSSVLEAAGMAQDGELSSDHAADLPTDVSAAGGTEVEDSGSDGSDPLRNATDEALLAEVARRFSSARGLGASGVRAAPALTSAPARKRTQPQPPAEDDLDGVHAAAHRPVKT